MLTPRFYKIFQAKNLKDGDQIRISEIAGRLGVGPILYGAFSVQNGDKNLVVLEMDYAGKSLGDSIDYDADPKDGDNRPPIEALAEKLYGSAEAFYSAFFQKIMLLAENKIAYQDSNAGNIIPRLDGEKKDLMLIDYDDALLKENPTAALRESIEGSRYYLNDFYYKRFQSLPNKSEEGKRLLALLKEKLGSN